MVKRSSSVFITGLASDVSVSMRASDKAAARRHFYTHLFVKHLTSEHFSTVGELKGSGLQESRSPPTREQHPTWRKVQIKSPAG